MGQGLGDYLFDGLLIVVGPNVVGKWKGLVAIGSGYDFELAPSAISEEQSNTFHNCLSGGQHI